MKMTLKMRNVTFELEFDTVSDVCEFINNFIRNNPTAFLVDMDNQEGK